MMFHRFRILLEVIVNSVTTHQAESRKVSKQLKTNFGLGDVVQARVGPPFPAVACP